MQFDPKTIEERFKNLPEEVQIAMTSTDIVEEIKGISDRNNLLIDQQAILFDLISYVMLGLIPSSSFVSTLAKEVNIDSERATKIAEEVNSEILNKIKITLKNELKAPNQEEVSPVDKEYTAESFEKAGDLSVEKPVSSENVPTDVETKDNILEGIENPQTGNEKISRKEGHEYMEPMIDHLLSTPSAQPIVKKESPLFSTGLPKSQETAPKAPAPNPAPVTPPPPPAPRSGPDPYRESV